MKTELCSYAPSFAPSRKNMSWLYDQLNNEWSRWLPGDTSKTIKYGAFYSSLVRPGFRIISLNGNYCNRNNFWLLLNSTDPMGQLTWLIEELNMAETKGEKVHIIGHIPPGQSDCLKIWSKNYYDIVNR
jgi:sphingomyelin phosphodiesterase